VFSDEPQSEIVKISYGAVNENVFDSERGGTRQLPFHKINSHQAPTQRQGKPVTMMSKVGRMRSPDVIKNQSLLDP